MKSRKFGLVKRVGAAERPYMDARIPLSFEWRVVHEREAVPFVFVSSSRLQHLTPALRLPFD